MFDVAVVGLGPAGRVLASRCASAGLSVLAIDPDPHRVWTQTLSMWRDQLPGWLPSTVFASTVNAPWLRAHNSYEIRRQYSVIDNAQLRKHLPLPSDKVTIEVGRTTGRAPWGLDTRARRVIDCRGTNPVAASVNRPRPAQTAFGVVLPTEVAAPALLGAPALLMDWTQDYRRGGSNTGLGKKDDSPLPSFLYAVPLGPDRVLLEETCLAGAPALDTSILRSRLYARLLARGISMEILRSPLATEEVRIPLVPETSWKTVPKDVFGVAAGFGHPATGYSLATTLQAVTSAVWALETGKPLPPPRPRSSTVMHHLGLRALLGVRADTTLDLFEAFGRLRPSLQQRFLSGTGPSYQVARAMGAMGLDMPLRAQSDMLAALSLPQQIARQ